jgi:hypothetical protein
VCVKRGALGSAGFTGFVKLSPENFPRAWLFYPAGSNRSVLFSVG